MAGDKTLNGHDVVQALEMSSLMGLGRRAMHGQIPWLVTGGPLPEERLNLANIGVWSSYLCLWNQIQQRLWGCPDTQCKLPWRRRCLARRPPVRN